MKSVQIAVDAKANSVTITAPPEKIGLAKKIIEENDKPDFLGQKPYQVSDPDHAEVHRAGGHGGRRRQDAAGDRQDATRRCRCRPATRSWFMERPRSTWLWPRSSTMGGDTTVGPTTARILIQADPTEMAAKLVKLYSSANGGPTIEAWTGRATLDHRQGNRGADQGGPGSIHAIEGTGPGIGGATGDPRVRRFYLSGRQRLGSGREAR